jgi:hypothetical protein
MPRERRDRFFERGDGHGGLREVAAQRGVQRGGGLRSDDLGSVDQRTHGPAEIAASPSANSASSARAVVTLACEVGVDRTTRSAKAGRARGVLRDQLPQRRRSQPRRVGAQGVEVLLDGGRALHARHDHAACFGIE